jgi:hypothetical protein
VRRPGNRFLARNPTPTNSQITRARARYWTRCLPQLRAAYRDICAYSAVWIPGHSANVDHFQPRSRFHALTYEWNNFRLSDQKINSRKADHIGVQDPFEVQPGWFVLDFASCYVKCNAGLDAGVTKRISKTISLLQLNDDQLAGQRLRVVRQYAGGTPLEDVERYYPFVASELTRQNLTRQYLTETFKASFGP